MSRQTHNRVVEELSGTVKRSTQIKAPALETENARLDVPVTFKQHSVAASQSAVALPVGLGTGDLTFWVAPRAGTIVSTSWGLSTAGTHTAGHVQFTVGGTAKGDSVAIDGGGTAAVVDQATPIPFNEGDKIGCNITTDGSWTPTPDLAVSPVIRWAA